MSTLVIASEALSPFARLLALNAAYTQLTPPAILPLHTEPQPQPQPLTDSSYTALAQLNDAYTAFECHTAEHSVPLTTVSPLSHLLYLNTLYQSFETYTLQSPASVPLSVEPEQLEQDSPVHSATVAPLHIRSPRYETYDKETSPAHAHKYSEKMHKACTTDLYDMSILLNMIGESDLSALTAYDLSPLPTECELPTGAECYRCEAVTCH